MKPTVDLVGRLTRKVTNVFGEGTAKRALFTVACNSYYKGQDGAKKENVDFVPCICWAGLVDVMTLWGLKGRLIHIKGTLETFQAGPDEHGKYPTMRVQVRVDSMEFLDKKPESIETPAKTPAAGTPETPGAGIDMVKLAEMVAAKLLTVTDNKVTPAGETAEETSNQAAAEEAANAQAQAGGDLASVT